ncbi:MAG: hypothetical protein WAK48_09195 [Candidatus Acidiferrum sp.]|jgi:hypothetical protein
MQKRISTLFLLFVSLLLVCLVIPSNSSSLSAVPLGPAVAADGVPPPPPKVQDQPQLVAIDGVPLPPPGPMPPPPPKAWDVRVFSN